MEEIDAQAFRFESDIGSRTVGISNIVKRRAGPDYLGACIEQPFSRQFSSAKALFPMLGVAVHACELAGRTWPAINLFGLALHASGKGSARKLAAQGVGQAFDLVLAKLLSSNAMISA